MATPGVTVRLLADVSGGDGAGLVRRFVEIASGTQLADAAANAQLWYVVAGNGVLRLPDRPGPHEHALRPDHSVLLPAGTRYQLTATGSLPLRLDAVTLPGPAAARQPAHAEATLIRALHECPVETTGDRRFRVLFGPGRDCAVATQFVGEIPPGRAPAHSHPYDEVVLILDGEGVAHAAGAQHPLGPGTCIHLPPGVLHCLENTGPGTLRVLGVFHPAGSPAAKLGTADGHH